MNRKRIMKKYECDPKGTCHSAVRELSRYYGKERGIPKSDMKVLEVRVPEKKSNHVVLSVKGNIYDPTRTQYSYKHKPIRGQLPSKYKLNNIRDVDFYYD